VEAGGKVATWAEETHANALWRFHLQFCGLPL